MFEQMAEMVASGSAVLGWAMLVLVLTAGRSIDRTDRAWVLIALPAVLAMAICYLGIAAGYYATGNNLARRRRMRSLSSGSCC